MGLSTYGRPGDIIESALSSVYIIHAGGGYSPIKVAEALVVPFSG